MRQALLQRHGDDTACVNAGSQVCNLSWSKNVNEIVSTHGYSQNQIIVWKHPTMTKLATLTGHTLRVLYLAVSPDGQTIVTGAGMACFVAVSILTVHLQHPEKAVPSCVCWRSKHRYRSRHVSLLMSDMLTH